MKIAFILLASVLVLFIIGYFVLHLAPFGSPPDKTTAENFKSSKNYDGDQGIFLNRRPTLVKEMRKRTMNFGLIKEFLSKGVDRSPGRPLPEVKPDFAEFIKPAKDLKVIWFGHSSFLMNFDGKIILVDPVFTNAGPFSFMVKRFQKPVAELLDLPKVDYIVISHDHYDHLDVHSIQFYKDKDVKFITPLGVGSHLKGWGVKSQNITELDWWQNHQVDELEFIATPAQHFSGRDGIHDNQTLWASWVIRNKKHNVYFSGDSGYDTHFKDIGEKYGPFDLAFIEDGQYNERWKEVHMLPEESVQAFYDLKAKRYFPVHWGTFVLALHTWYDPIESLEKASKEKGFNLISPKMGQTVIVNDDYTNEVWWRSP